MIYILVWEGYDSVVHEEEFLDPEDLGDRLDTLEAAGVVKDGCVFEKTFVGNA